MPVVKERGEREKHQASGTLFKASPSSCHSPRIKDKDKISCGAEAYRLPSSHTGF